MAFLLGVTRSDLGLLGAATAAIALLIWVFVQMMFIPFSFLQALYFAFGIAETGLVLVALGILRLRSNPGDGPSWASLALCSGRRQARLILFVAAAFGISWTLWFLQPVFAHDPGVALTLDQLATFGPAAAALLVADDRSASAGVRPRTLALIAGIATLALTALLLTPRWMMPPRHSKKRSSSCSLRFPRHSSGRREAATLVSPTCWEASCPRDPHGGRTR